MKKRNHTPDNELTNLVGTQLDETLDGDALAQAAHYSRSHFQRVFSQTTGETPGSCRRRLLLERAAYQLLNSEWSVTEIALESGFDSLEGFSRAFRQVAGVSPSQFRQAQPLSWFLASPNDIHYDPVVGAAIHLSQPVQQGGIMDLTELLISHDLWLTRRFLEKAQSLSDAQLDKPLDGFDNPLLYRGEEKNLRDLLDKLVFTKEVWMAAIHGRKLSDNLDNSVQGMMQRLESAGGEFLALTRKVRDEKLWDADFMDMLCEPPETFNYGGMIAHILTFSAYRRTVAIEVLEQFGITDLGFGDPMQWQRTQNDS